VSIRLVLMGDGVRSSGRKVVRDLPDLAAALRAVADALDRDPTVRFTIDQHGQALASGGPLACRSCETRRRAGFSGQCPSCNWERERARHTPCTTSDDQK
jgi:hypothetical protein